jgi:membrane associated rhomboid family serine protease
VVFASEASVYVIPIIVAIMVGVYPLAIWRKMSFTAATVIANVIIFAIYFIPGGAGGPIYYDVVRTLGFNNQEMASGEALYTLYTHMYIHADFFHVIFNMFLFYIMGIHFEHRVGFKWMAIVYWTTGILGGGVLNGILTISTNTTGIGASAAISGVIGTFAIMYPRDRVPMVLIFIILPRVQVAFGALVFILFQSFMMFFAVSIHPSLGTISYTAHLAGVMVGVVIGFILLKKGVEAPQPGASLSRRLDRLDYEKLRPLLRKPANEQRLDSIIGEDIPEVKEVLLEDLISRLRCPECDSIMMMKGALVRCEKCEWRLDLRAGK